MKHSVLSQSFLVILAALLAVCGVPQSYGLGSQAGSSPKSYQQAYDYLLQRIRSTADETPPNLFPMYADLNGQWHYAERGWTRGLWVGCLWMAYSAEEDPAWLGYATDWNSHIFGEETRDHHDRGFEYYYSSAWGYELTSEQMYYDSVIQAADHLTSMRNAATDLIPYWGDKPIAIIDTMMNLQLLWWTYEKAGELIYYQVASSHALSTLRYFVRQNVPSNPCGLSDFSTWQAVRFDPEEGQIMERFTYQGYDDCSTWARGQAWGLYGFTVAYEKTGTPIFLEAAEGLGQYIIETLPDDNVPWFDFVPEAAGTFRDTSAGSIASAAFFRLAAVEPDASRSIAYKLIGHRILHSLIDDHLTPLPGVSAPPGMLLHGCSYYGGPAADNEVIWGDMFLLEALLYAMSDGSSQIYLPIVTHAFDPGK
jgi:unsaturated chondroitin disaccharide hydrolase